MKLELNYEECQELLAALGGTGTPALRVKLELVLPEDPFLVEVSQSLDFGEETYEEACTTTVMVGPSKRVQQKLTAAS